MDRRLLGVRTGAVVALFALAACSSMPCSAQTTYVETFEDGLNQDGWTWGTGNEFIRNLGGNPGKYLYEPLVDTFAPQPFTGAPSSPFHGNFRARGVVSVGIDLITHYVDFSAAGRPLSILLESDNGTATPNDDWAVYLMGPTNIPLPGQGWLSYDFSIPADATSLPPEWAYLPYGPGSPAVADWNKVITAVTQLRLFYGNPEKVFIFQQWKLGLDNARITTTKSGADPGRVPPTVTMAKVAVAQVTIRWSSSDCAGGVDYGLYEGTIGNWYSHARISCTDAGSDLEQTFTPSSGNRYYLVVPRGGGDEGSYGLAWDFSASIEAERPPAAVGACAPAQVLGCP